MDFLGPLSFVLLALFGALLFLLASARLRRLEDQAEDVARGLARWETEVQRWEAAVQRWELALSQERQNLEDDLRRDRLASEQREEARFEELAQRIVERQRVAAPSVVEDSSASLEGTQQIAASLGRELAELKAAVQAARAAAEDARAGAERASAGAEALKSEFERLALAQERAVDGRATLTRLVVEHLEAQGFDRVSLFGDLEPRHPEDTQRVRVEAARRDATWKGSVSVRNGRVVDVSLQPSYSMFP